MRALKKESGQDLVEFALIAPILFAVLFGIVEFGVAVWRYNTVANTARETVREFVVYNKADREPLEDFETNVVEPFAMAYAEDLGLVVSRTTIEYDELPLVITGTTGAITYTRLAVTVTYGHQSITGLFTGLFDDEFAMQASASMLAEGER